MSWDLCRRSELFLVASNFRGHRWVPLHDRRGAERISVWALLSCFVLFLVVCPELTAVRQAWSKSVLGSQSLHCTFDRPNCCIALVVRSAKGNARIRLAAQLIGVKMSRFVDTVRTTLEILQSSFWLKPGLPHLTQAYRLSSALLLASNACSCLSWEVGRV